MITNCQETHEVPANPLRVRAFLWITAVVVYAFILAPVIFVPLVSVFSNKIMGFPPDGYTLEWYANIWHQPTFLNGFILSVEVALVATTIGLAVGLLASLALVRFRFRGSDAVATFLLSPLIVPGIVAGTAILIFFTEVYAASGIHLTATLPGLVLAHTTVTIPWTVRLISANLLGIDPSLEEAARNLGAGPFTALWRVTLPVIRPAIIAAALFAFLASYDNLEISLFLVGPGHTTLPIAILQYLEFNLDPTIAAVAVVQIVIVALVILISNRFVRLAQVV